MTPGKNGTARRQGGGATGSAERARMSEIERGVRDWRLWGPYLSERQWGTVREDYSADGSAWSYFPHDHARSRAYRWGEDGIAGISDVQQRLCFAVALWNGQDPILKERMFGLTNGEGNHGEDVKEQYYYLDATPSHSYLKMLYKYPHAAFPYARLVEENARRGAHDPEFELVDTGVFDANRYCDVFIEYAKAGVDDILIEITAHNRGPEPTTLHMVPQLWFRNTWSWKRGTNRPSLRQEDDGDISATHADLGEYHLYFDDAEGVHTHFCENETNTRRLYGGGGGPEFPKDGINDRIVNGSTGCVNPEGQGTKCAVQQVFRVDPGGKARMRLRLRAGTIRDPFRGFDTMMEQARREADTYYAELQGGLSDEDGRLVQRQALAGMIWSKQFFYYDVPEWLGGDEAQPAPPEARRGGRNAAWEHLNNADVISMPDKWEYPWFAAWDLAFHCIPLAMVDPMFAKEQLLLLTREWYMHPNGQLPAYEWALGDVNPPVHAWATWRVFEIDRQRTGGDGDLAFLERVFHKLMLNFTWWVNRKDAEGRNIFQGGFLGLDNIGVFDRSAPLPTGGSISQSDGTSWMAMYSLNLMRIALELALHNPVYEDIATKFFEHFLHIAEAMTSIGGRKGVGLWDEEDEFFYDVLNLPNGEMKRLRVRSMVGLIPMFAVEVLDPELLERLPGFRARLEWFLNYRPDLAQLVSRWHEPGRGERRLLSLLRGHRLKALLRRMLDENEFLAPYGVRALSRVHEGQPYEFRAGGSAHVVRYQPGESDSGLFGGNSNWRGPIWMPVNYLIIESLRKFHHYYGPEFRVACPTESEQGHSLGEVADELTTRLTRIFLKDASGRRPVLAQHPRIQDDPLFHDCIPFHEYFHSETGRGVGASHQTGWTGLIARLLTHQPLECEVCAHLHSRAEERNVTELMSAASK